VIIGIDGSCLQGIRTGAGWYLTHLLEAMSLVLEEDKIYVWMNNPTPEERARVNENRFVAVSATRYPAAALRLTWNTLGTPAMDSLIGRQGDVYFYPNYLPLPQKQGKKALFVHDLTFLTNPELASQNSLKSIAPHLEKEEEKADLILTCSEYNRQEMLKHFRHLPENKIRVIPHGLPDIYRGPAPAEKVKVVREKFGLAHPYFFFVGTLELRKNLLRLVHAFLLFKQKTNADHQLILAGPRGWIGEDFMSFILSPQLVGKVRWLDYVSAEDLPALYTGASAFVFPSLKEGFGMPLLEAMGCGAPVLCSKSAAIPEVVGDGAWMMDAGNVGEWAKAMERIATEPSFSDVLRDKGRARASLFQIENTAKQTLAALKLTVKSHA
jgi:glycosyltransferase involved in cell wall biosynthesis